LPRLRFFVRLLYARPMKAEFRDIPGTGGDYVASSDGRIWSRKNARWGQRETLKEMRQYIRRGNGQGGRGSGHATVGLCVNKRSIGPRFVHELMLITFVGPRPAGMECRHLDGNPANNALSNLAWGTRSENSFDRFAHGTGIWGERAKRAVLTEAIVADCRRRTASGECIKDLAEEYRVNYVTLRDAVAGTNWKRLTDPPPVRSPRTRRRRGWVNPLRRK
jgi:hypothetical protein